LRCDRKISQQDLAKACHITPSALSKIEAGINSPRASVIWRIAMNLGVTVEYLLDEAMPYPYTGYSYRQDFLANNVDPQSTVRCEVTREEKSFLEALRQTNQIARHIALSLPEAPVESLRLVHFILNHGKLTNLSRGFLKSFESLFKDASAETPAAPQKSASAKKSRPRASAPRQKRRRQKAGR
jgi:transcriptional regulator with XRE-family HTH domain